MLMGWIGFFLSMLILLVLSQKNLGIAMFAGAIVLGIFFAPESLPSKIWESITDPRTIFLAGIVSLIPVIGGVLNETGQMDRLINNMQVGRKLFLMLSPALIGLLPMPGGALLSAPLIDKAGADIPYEKKAGINIWFRHVLYLIYPLSADLIVSTAAAGIKLYQPIPILSLILLFSLVLGYFFFLGGKLEKMNYEKKFSLRELLPPLTVLLAAPIIDLVLKEISILPIGEIATFIAVLISLMFAILIGKLNLMRLYRIVIGAKPWDFAFMMVGIMVFLGVFKGLGVFDLFMNVFITPDMLFGIAFLLGFVTGRIVTPAGIIFPIYLMKFGQVSLPVFALIYFGIFLGYVITPVHPCVSLTLASFKVDLKSYLKIMIRPVCIAMFASLLILHLITSISL